MFVIILDILGFIYYVTNSFIQYVHGNKYLLIIYVFIKVYIIYNNIDLNVLKIRNNVNYLQCYITRIFTVNLTVNLLLFLDIFYT